MQPQHTEETETRAREGMESACAAQDAKPGATGSLSADACVTLDPQAPITKSSLPQLADYLRRGVKAKSARQCGVEFEVFGYTARDYQRLDARQVQKVLTQLAAATAPHSTSIDNLILEEGVVVEALMNGGRVTVEPGGQIEFSGAPRSSLIEVETDVRAFLARLHEIAEENSFVFLATGFDPIRRIDEQRWFPKARYKVMRPYLALQGARAWDMMCRTCAVQINLDYETETDLAKKFILGNRLAPIVTAIFANSPFENGALSNYKSTRAAAWLETDDARCGVSPLAFQENFSPEEFVEYALSVPLIFIRRGNVYSDAAAGLSFSEFLGGKAPSIEPLFQDWIDHLTTIFTEARLKQYLELRSADGGNLQLAMALAALWRGLMYDAEAFEETLRIAPKLNGEAMRELEESVAHAALAAQHAVVRVLPLAKDLIALAGEGLRRFAPGEEKYLDILREQVIEQEVCPADLQLRNYQGAWHNSFIRVLENLRIA